MQRSNEAWIITVDNKEKKNVIWIKLSAYDKERFLSFMQYAIDSIPESKDFLLYNPDSGLCYDAYKYATEVYHIRKRTFNERMEDVKTWRLDNVSA